MLEQLMQTAVQYIDTAMVGALGTLATAAVGATSTVNWLISGSLSALGVGFLSYVARACGAGERWRFEYASPSSSEPDGADAGVAASRFVPRSFEIRRMPW